MITTKTKILTKKSLIKFLVEHKACKPDLTWAKKQRRARDIIEKCPNVDHLRWLIETIGGSLWDKYYENLDLTWAEYEEKRAVVVREICTFERVQEEIGEQEISNSNKSKFVVIESPYAPTPTKGLPVKKSLVCLARNIAYVQAAMNDSFLRGEIPFASHALYTQPGVLDDTIPKQRKQGINAGFTIAKALSMLPDSFNFSRIFYIDRGWSGGMKQGEEDAVNNKQKIEYRSLGHTWSKYNDQNWTLDISNRLIAIDYTKTKE